MSEDATIDKLRAAAEDGDAKAALTLGEIYMKNESVPRNEQEALRWFMRAAQLKDRLSPVVEQQQPKRRGKASLWTALAILVLGGAAGGGWYYWAPGWYFSNAQQQAMQGNAEKAVEYFTKSAEMGDMRAQAALGEAYVSPNPKASVTWYTKAAEQGDARSQYKLARAYAEGRGVPRDMNRYAEWLKKAAAQNMAEAQSELGLYELSGEYGARAGRRAQTYRCRRAGGCECAICTLPLLPGWRRHGAEHGGGYELAACGGEG